MTRGTTPFRICQAKRTWAQLTPCLMAAALTAGSSNRELSFNGLHAWVMIPSDAWNFLAARRARLGSS